MKKYAGLVILMGFIALGCVQRQDRNMVYIKGGTFTMGSPAGEAGRDFDETPHQVAVSSFLLGKYEVTQDEYQKIMKDIPCNFKGKELPVESISWYDAVLFCNMLSRKRGLTPAYDIKGPAVMWDRNADGYRLPTEAEWEYACRAGTSTAFNTGSSITTEQANFNGTESYNNNAQGLFIEKTMPVGSYPANAWGLYDMHGNVFEWCWDLHSYYDLKEQTDPTGPVSGSLRIIRGGSWVNGGETLRSACRGIYIPGGGNERIGFRLARNAEEAH
ncbi:MAG: formylglycine-generating enzyme family protein [Treponema sp.]|jgi:formylglycine-generating enzyme required for sulfatase activity|nr:formylglycine-generating enzyme family protein [Treponema sp.]